MAGLMWLPLIAATSLIPHQLAYLIAYQNARVRAEVLAKSGHSYLDFAPEIISTCVALTLVAAVLWPAQRKPGNGRPIPAWPFAVLPFAMFTLQEHLERLLAHENVLTVALDPTFVLGLTLQIPFAFAAFLLARLLVRGVQTLVAAFVEVGGTATLVSYALPPAEGLLVRRCVSVLGRGAAGRAPPAFSRAR